MSLLSAARLLLRKRLVSPNLHSDSARPSKPSFSRLYDALLSKPIQEQPFLTGKLLRQLFQQQAGVGRGSVDHVLSKAAILRTPKLAGATSLVLANRSYFSSVALRSKSTLAAQSSQWGPICTNLQQRLYTSSVNRSLAVTAKPRFLSTASTASLTTLVKGGVKAQKQVAYWLFGSAAWVFSMVVLGGVTRLTRSGLSMTDWRFAGGLPPLTAQEWEEEFNKYKQSPEYKKVNLGMKLDDFKFIYWMEYAHRMWGRALGLVFTVPFAYFAVKGYITRPLAARLGVLLLLGGGQGLVGWWMVKSGLQEPKSEHDVPRVSPYRLAAHLTSAFVIYSGLLWTALSVASPSPPALSDIAAEAGATLRAKIHPLAALIGVTALSGAFVAGLDAGHAFNTFPKMGDTWLPPGLFEKQPFFTNFFENTATVQLDHRLLALTTLATVSGVWATSRGLPLHPRSKLLLNALMGMTALQVTLGISTLLTYVPVSLGSAHQAGALTLFTIVLMLMHSLRRPRPAALKSMVASRRMPAETLQPT